VAHYVTTRACGSVVRCSALPAAAHHATTRVCGSTVHRNALPAAAHSYALAQIQKMIPPEAAVSASAAAAAAEDTGPLGNLVPALHVFCYGKLFYI